jgi:hypothetical protein
MTYPSPKTMDLLAARFRREAYELNIVADVLEDMSRILQGRDVAMPNSLDQAKMMNLISANYLKSHEQPQP